MPTSVTMPQLGETVVEGTITKWLKQEGDRIDRDEPLFEISTDKVDTEVPSPVAGTVAKILVPEGETVSVGTELVQIEEGDAQAAAPAAAEQAEAPEPAEQPAEEEPAEEEPAEGATEEAEEEAAPEPEREERQPAAAAAPAPRSQAAEAPAAGGPRSHILSPLVRKLAEEHDLDLGQVQGTGTGGRITKRDVLAFIESGGAAAPAAATAAMPAPEAVPLAVPAAAPRPTAAGPREETVPMTHIRKTIARLRERTKDAFKAREGIGLTFMPFLARALCDALLAFPDVNGELRDEQIVLKRYVNLGIAVAYDEGLIVPVVKDAEGINLVGLARAINDVATRARSKKLKPDEVHGSTFTITNPGPYGSIMSVPIINQPNTAILAFDAIEKRPVVIDDAIAIRHMVYLSMSWDHRVIDGAAAAQFLGRLKQNLETWDFTPELQAYLAQT